VASSVYVSEQMWDFTTDTNLLFKDDIGTVLYCASIFKDSWAMEVSSFGIDSSEASMLPLNYSSEEQVPCVCVCEWWSAYPLPKYS
jgi:hypothetical protein